MAGFNKINFSATDTNPDVGQFRLKGLARGETTDPSGFRLGGAARIKGLPFDASDPLSRASSEAVGRLFLQTYLEDAGSETLLALTTPSRPEQVPDMQVVETVPSDALGANSVVFQQTYKGYPVFGGRVAVDVDRDDNSFVSINGQVAPLPDADPIAQISARDACTRLAQWGGRNPDAEEFISLEPPQLIWYFDENSDRWHLTYHFSNVPMKPRADEVDADLSQFASLSHFCLGHSPRNTATLCDYFVDAAEGDVVFFFSASAAVDIPIPMQGPDVDGINRKFFGLRTANGFRLTDPLRELETYDFALQDIDRQPLPAASIVSSATQNLTAAESAAVSAHHNATLVFNFFNDVLKRKSVDNRGMKLKSIVNVWSSQSGTPTPEWKNAVWWQNQMWYGQSAGVSLAKYLDVIAHELTHGVTQTSSNLVYRGLSGALNESFSDTFGVIIANWYPNEPEPIQNWDWEIGPGLGAQGGPLRDFSDPSRTGQPDHFSQFQPLPVTFDNGGVHIYSGIHNKAVYALLSGTDDNSDPTFPVFEAALLLYLTLTRLTRMSDFHDSRRTLENVVRAYHTGDTATMTIRLQAIDDAYSAVGL